MIEGEAAITFSWFVFIIFVFIMSLVTIDWLLGKIKKDWAALPGEEELWDDP